MHLVTLGTSLNGDSRTSNARERRTSPTNGRSGVEDGDSIEHGDAAVVSEDGSDVATEDEGEDEEEDENEEEDEDEGGFDMELDSSDEEEDEDEAEEHLINRYGFRRTRREDVELDVPCSSHTKVYRGHCNIKTVKDVNYFGLNDEYVVSGSDSGHIFIWDRKTTNLVNILEADSEVVNVVQGMSILTTYTTLAHTCFLRTPVRTDHRRFWDRQHHQDLLTRSPCTGQCTPWYQHPRPR